MQAADRVADAKQTEKFKNQNLRGLNQHKSFWVRIGDGIPLFWNSSCVETQFLRQAIGLCRPGVALGRSHAM